MNGHLKLVTLVLTAVLLAIPGQGQSGHFDELRNNSNPAASRGVTISIHLPAGILFEQGCIGTIRPDGMPAPRESSPTFRNPYYYSKKPKPDRAVRVTLSFRLFTRTCEGNHGFPGLDPGQHDIDLTMAIAPLTSDPRAGSFLDRHGNSSGIFNAGTIRSGTAHNSGTESNSEGSESGRVELTVVKSYPDSGYVPSSQSRDRGPGNNTDSSMKIFSDFEPSK